MSPYPGLPGVWKLIFFVFLYFFSSIFCTFFVLFGLIFVPFLYFYAGVHKIKYSPHACGGNFFKVDDVLGKNIHFSGKLLNKKGEKFKTVGGRNSNSIKFYTPLHISCISDTSGILNIPLVHGSGISILEGVVAMIYRNGKHS